MLTRAGALLAVASAWVVVVAAAAEPPVDLPAVAAAAWEQDEGALGGSVEFWIERLVNASKEYYEAGEVDEGVHVRGATYFFETTTVFSLEDTKAFDEPVACFRIPSVVQTASGRLLAFAEGRLHTCADCVTTGIASKASDDGGRTWTNLQWVVEPTDVGANPTVVFDRGTNRTFLHYVRGSQDGTDCIPGTNNYQVVSADDGETWGTPLDISSDLGDFVGCLPGPGNGVQLAHGDHAGRMLVACHFSTAERSDGRVVVYYTDDGGATYALSNADLPRMDESTIAEAPDGTVLVNMRNDPWVTQNGCNCRAVARSADGGDSFGPLKFDGALVDPVCEGSLAAVDDLVLFSNPPMKYARANLTVQVSADSGRTWARHIRIADSAALSDYSSIVQGTLQHGGEDGVAGVLFGSCAVPIPFRPWCMLGRAWNVYFTRFPLDDGDA